MPQSLVLGLLLFALYTTPLSSLISSLSLNHHLYADDTKPFCYCNSVHYCFFLLNRLQNIDNVPARAVVEAPRSACSPNQIHRSLHWLKVHERIEYIVISATCNLLQSSSPRYLLDLTTVQPSRST